MASRANEAVQMKQQQDRHHRHEIEQLKRELEEVKTARQKTIDSYELKVLGLQKTILRIREKEREVLDSKKQAELGAKEMERRAEELRLQLVEADAARDTEIEKREAADAKLHREQQAASKAALLAHQSAHINEEKVEKLRHRCAQISGKLGGKSSTRRSTAEVAAMATDSSHSHNAFRCAKQRIVVRLGAAIEEAKPQPELIARALQRSGVLNTLMKDTKFGQDLLYSHGVQLSKTLHDVWDVDLSTECKVELGLTDFQMEELRFKLSHEWREGRWERRQWFKHAKTGDVVNFPTPLASKYKWRTQFVELCSKHQIELLGGGKVAQRGFSEGLALLLTRCDPLLPPPEEVTPENPLLVSLGWDALKHAGRHITHGGMKLASFRRGVASTQSELNFVSTNIFRDNDDYHGLVRGLKAWVPSLNEAKRLKIFKRDAAAVAERCTDALLIGGGIGGKAPAAELPDPAVSKLPREHYDIDFAITLDLSAMRSISGRAKGCASHCECDDGDSTQRSHKLHHWPEVRGDGPWRVLRVILQKECRLLTKERRRGLSHTVAKDHDWRKPADCEECEWTATLKEYKHQLAEMEVLLAASKTKKEARKKLDTLRKKHRMRHYKSELMHEDLLDAFDSLEFVTDMMHGMPLNLAKILFKYSFLDVLIEPEQREQLAEYLHRINCPFDCRIESESGWMRASAMQAFECGSSTSPGLGPNIFALCDLAYGADCAEDSPDVSPGDAQQPEPSAEPPQPPQQPSQPPQRERDTVRRPRRGAAQTRRAEPAPAVQPGAQPPAAARAPAAAPPSVRQRPKDCDDDMWAMLSTRYGEHAAVVFEIMKAWGEYHELSELLAMPLEQNTKEAREERACEVAHTAIRFAHRFEGVCNSRHRSWYLHNFVYVVPRQIERYGALWPFSTAALESRGARIKRVKVSWRGYCDTPKQHKRDWNTRVSVFKQTYRSSPTLQLMRMISAAEDMYHDGKGRGGARFKQTGRFRKVKLEADHSNTASYETDPFAALTSFLADAHVQAGNQ